MALSSSNIQQMTAKMADTQMQQSNVINDMDEEAGLLQKTNERIDETNVETQGLFDSAAGDQSAIDALNAEIIATNDKRNEDNIAISDQCIKDCDEARKMKDTKIHLKKFVDESGMCGMGMGMGNTYSECGAIDLTAEELVALKDELLDLGDSQDTFDSNFQQITDALNEKLGESGSKVSTGSDNDGGTYLEIKRSDGSSVKIYDANGNGALDNKDYDFCQAIQQAEQIIKQMNDKIDSINAKAQADVAANNERADAHIADLKEQIAQLQSSKDATLELAKHNEEDVLPNLQAKADLHETNYNNDKVELDVLEKNEDDLAVKLDGAKAAQKAEDAKAEEAKADEAKVAEEPKEKEKEPELA